MEKYNNERYNPLSITNKNDIYIYRSRKKNEGDIRKKIILNLLGKLYFNPNFIFNYR